MATKAEKIAEMQRQKAEEKAIREKEHKKVIPSTKTDTTDFTDDIINAIANGALSNTEKIESLPEPKPETKKENEISKIETGKEYTTATKQAEKKDGEKKRQQNEESQSLSSKLLFQAKKQTKSVHKSVTLRPDTVSKVEKLLKEQYNGLSFNDLFQQLLDVWVAENEKHFNL